MQSSLKQFGPPKNRSGVFSSIIDTIGQTPIVRIRKMGIPDGVTLYAKLESENPGGSVKDRLAHGVVEWAERFGHLQPGQTVVEATSGNTGIGLAMVCAAKGYPFVAVMAESFSIERRKLMRFLGAKVVLTNPAHKGSGMILKAKELADQHGYFWPNQFESQANAWIHEQTTGPEIVQAFQELGEPLDHFVCAYGTGGTLKGVATYLKEHSPNTKVHVCEPDNAPLLYSEIETKYPHDGIPSTSFEVPHPVWRPHLMQGWVTDFIPKLVSEAKDANLYHNLLQADGFDAVRTSQKLAALEGIFTGISGGAMVSCAIHLANSLPSKQEGTINILCILPDTGERYLSTPLFADIPADMTEEEKALAASTPSSPPPPAGLPEVLPEATEFVQTTNQQHKMVIWSLKYCEFCWTICKLMDRLGVPYTVVDIDNFLYAKDNMGNKYRAALSALTDCPTFPQFFVQGKFIGGAVDACLMWKKGELQPLLTDAGLNESGNFNGYEGDPFEFLPKWMSQNPHRSK